MTDKEKKNFIDLQVFLNRVLDNERKIKDIELQDIRVDKYIKKLKTLLKEREEEAVEDFVQWILDVEKLAMRPQGLLVNVADIKFWKEEYLKRKIELSNNLEG